MYYEIYGAICRVQPGLYSLDQLEKMDLNKIMKLLAFSEKIVGRPIFDTKAIREGITKSSQKIKSTGGLSSVSQEEIDLVKNMIFNEEAQNGEFF